MRNGRKKIAFLQVQIVFVDFHPLPLLNIAKENKLNVKDFTFNFILNNDSAFKYLYGIARHKHGVIRISDLQIAAEQLGR